jgi:hypothetical protein
LWWNWRRAELLDFQRSLFEAAEWYNAFHSGHISTVNATSGGVYWRGLSERRIEVHKDEVEDISGHWSAVTVMAMPPKRCPFKIHPAILHIDYA